MDGEPIGLFITWTCYGSWLPGDERGWLKWHRGERGPQPMLEKWCREQMTESIVNLDTNQRTVVEQAIRDHCSHRNWQLHAVTCRTNHCHVVVSAGRTSGEQVRDQFKSWATRRLNDDQRSHRPQEDKREQWWTRLGCVQFLFDEESLEAVIQYTQDQ